MFVIGVDPHKGSHTAAALSSTEEVIAEVRVYADAKQLDHLLEWAEAFSPRRWAVEGAGGTGALLARQLVAAGEEVLDVAPTLSARVRLLDRGRSAKTDAHDARAIAIVALRHANLRSVVVEDHDAVLRLLADRHHDLVAQRTRVVCRLHALLSQLLMHQHSDKRIDDCQPGRYQHPQLELHPVASKQSDGLADRGCDKSRSPPTPENQADQDERWITGHPLPGVSSKGGDIDVGVVGPKGPYRLRLLDPGPSHGVQLQGHNRSGRQ